MIKEALEYLVSLKDNKTYEIDGVTYSDNELNAVQPPVYRRETMRFYSLDAIVRMVRAELEEYEDMYGLPVFVAVESPKKVKVFTRTDLYERRVFPFTAECVDTDFSEGWRDQQSAIIEIRSRFIPTEDSEYLLKLISRINQDQGVQSDDNGVSQTVVVKSGVSLMASEVVKPRVSLKPFRTFREVAQPESEFILRLDDKGRVGIMEADGGIWKIEARDNIKAYFEKHLADEIRDGKVIVII